jgi:hypothetical protein
MKTRIRRTDIDSDSTFFSLSSPLIHKDHPNACSSDPSHGPISATPPGRSSRLGGMPRCDAHALGTGQRRSDSKINRSNVTLASAAASAAATAACAIAGFQPS